MSRRALLVLVLSACGGGSTKNSSAPPPAPPVTPVDSPAPVAKPVAPPAPTVSAACKEQATKLGSTMSELGKTQPGFLPMVQIKAPVSKGAKPVDKRGIVFALTKDGAIYAQGQKLKDVAEARMYLEQAHRTVLEKTIMDGGTAADATLILYIWADRATPVRTIAALAAATEEEKRKPGKAAKAAKKAPPSDDPPPPEEEDNLARDAAIKQAKAAGIIGGPDKPRPPAFTVRLIVTSADNAPAIDAAIGAKLPASDPEATKAVVDQLKAAIGTCEPIFTALATSSLGGTPDKELAKLTAEVPAGLTSCQCKAASIDDLTTGIRLWFGAWAPSLQWIDLPKLKATDKQPISKLVK